MPLRSLFLILLLTELASYAAYFFPWLGAVGFFAVATAALVLSLRRLEYGLYFVMADLILGGKSGQLFSFEYEGFLLSLRMALFIVVMSVWAGKWVSAQLHNAPQPPLNSDAPQGRSPTEASDLRGGVFWWWAVFGLAVVWGMVIGLTRGNDFGNLFLDANGYFYGAMILPFLWVFSQCHPEERSDEGSRPNVRDAHTREILRFAQNDRLVGLGIIFFAATTFLALKTLFSLYLFTHGSSNFIAANLFPYFRWIRDTGVGEITMLPGNFTRVFFQSQIYNVVAFFVGLAILVHHANGRERRREWIQIFMWLTLNTAVIMVSLSRSFWVGVMAGMIVLVIGHIRRIGHMGRNVVLAGTAAIVLLLLVARFPLPRPSPMDLSTATESRLAFEPAAASRWNLLPAMWSAVREHPILGSGFGRTVTYVSNDPRIRAVNPTGEYTTAALEWGWIDFWLKLGLIGLIGPIGLILMLARASIRLNLPFVVAILGGLATIHFFTPYLNHPLGIGVLLLTTFAIYDRMV